MAAYSSSQSICPASDDALFHFDCPSQFRLITAVSTKSSASGRRSSAWAAGSMPLLSNATSGGRSSIGGGDDVGLPSISGVADPLSIELDEWFTHRHERHFLAATQPTAEASPESGILWSDAIIEDSEIKGRGLSSSPVRRSSYRLSASPMSPLSPVAQPSTSDVHSTSHKRKQANASDSSSNSSSSHIKRAKVGSSEIGANRNISTTNRANNTGASSGNNSRFNTNTTTASISSTSTSTIKKGGSNLSRSGSFATKPALQINTKSNSKSSSSSSSSSTSSSYLHRKLLVPLPRNPI